jgi:hypothetical protein
MTQVLIPNYKTDTVRKATTAEVQQEKLANEMRVRRDKGQHEPPSLKRGDK